MKKKILKWFKVFLICYCALYCLRFAQLNFSGNQLIAAQALPYFLLADDEELMLYNKDNLSNITVNVQWVDLNGDLKKELIINKSPLGFYCNEIYGADADGKYKEIAFFYTRDANVVYFPPLTLWGYPHIVAAEGVSHAYGIHQWDRAKQCYKMRK